MRRPVSAAVLAIATWFGVGCGATLTAKRMPAHDPGACLNGIVANQKIPYEVLAVFPTEPGSKEYSTIETDAMLPSAKEVYVIGYRGQLFTSRDLEVELFPDTTIKRVKVGSEGQTEQLFKDLTAAAAQAGAINDALKPEDKDMKSNAETSKALCKQMLAVNKADADNARKLTYEGVLSCP